MRKKTKPAVKKDRSFTDSSELTAFRAPKVLTTAARDKCKREDLTFSQLMRRALRRELSLQHDAEHSV